MSLCTLPSLFGCPRDLDLRGSDANEARRVWQEILLDRPGFELEAGALTLPEIQNRAAAFDPLTLAVDAEVRAISANAWFSLGRHGLGLHFLRAPGTPGEVAVLRCAGRGKFWEVLIDGQQMARFTEIEEAVAAVDYELGRLGRDIAASAHPAAAWRRGSGAEKGLARHMQQLLWDRIVRRES